MIKTVIIVGKGKLSSSLLLGLPEYLNGCKIDLWENNGLYPDADKVIVHIGSGRQFNEVISFCEKTGTPLIQGSTDIADDLSNATFTYIDSPNFNILMLKFMHMIKEYGVHFQKNDISITESHQESKKSMPGTAIEFARSLGFPSGNIASVRNPEVQKKQYGIPEEHLHLHAFHEIVIRDAGTSINIKTLVKGHESYVAGLAAIIRATENLDTRYYHIMDLMDMGLI